MKKILVISLACMLVIVSCSKKTTPVSSVAKKTKTLSDQEQLEYSYGFSEATRLYVFGNYKQALGLYLKCLELNPASDASMFQLANIYTFTGNVTEALKYSRMATLSDTANVWYQLQAAQLYKAANMNDSVIKVYENLVKKQPKQSEFKINLAVLYIDNHDYKAALNLLDQIETEFGVGEQISMTKYQIYVRQKKYDLAESELLKLIASFPDDFVKYNTLLAEFYRDTKNDIKCIQTYEKIFELEPDNAQALLSLADYYQSRSEVDKQLVVLEKALKSTQLDTDNKISVLIGIMSDDKLYARSSDLVSSQLDFLFKTDSANLRLRAVRADYFIRTQNYGQAQSELAFVLSKERTNYSIWENYLLLANSNGDMSSLSQYADSAMILFPDKPLPYFFKGLYYYNGKEFEKGIGVLNKGITYVGDNVRQKIQFLSLIAELYARNNQHDKSFVYYEQILDLEPNEVTVLNNYAYYLALRNEKLDKAKKMIQHATQLEPDNATYLDTYAWILYVLKDFNKAHEYIKKAYESGGYSNPEIVDHYGDILYRLGKTDQAIELWKNAKELGSENPELDKKIQNGL